MILLTTNHVVPASRNLSPDFEDFAKHGDGDQGYGDGDGGVQDMDEVSEYTPPHVRMCVSQMYLVMQLLEPDP